MAKKKNKKIVRYRKPLNINVGMIIFACIFVYLIFNVYTYMSKDKVQFYEVMEGGIVNDRNYTGFILREESTQYTDKAGNVNYYIREGKRAALGARVYSIDETGQMEDFLENNQGAAIEFTEDNLSDLKKQLSSFSAMYSDTDFMSVTATRTALTASITEYVNFNMLGNLEVTMSQSGISFEQVHSDQPGIVSCVIDGYETVDPTQISEDLFDRSQYKPQTIQSGQIIARDAPVYKLITSDDWSLVFPLTEEDVSLYNGKERLTVQFADEDLTAEGKYTMITGTDGKPYGKLDFSKYMIQFVSKRYLDFEIVAEKEVGLKIPATAVATKDFFTVPVDYLSQGGDDSLSGLLKETYSESGTSTVFTPVTIYYQTEEYCYIETGGKEGINAGDYVVKPNSTDRFQVGPVATLQGAYNINKGYTVFKQIDVLSSNGEYYTIAKNTTYGLSVYDHIVLDAASVGEGELIYQ